MTVMPMMPVPAVPTAAMPEGAAVPVDAEGSFAALFAAVLTQSQAPAAEPQTIESDEVAETLAEPVTSDADAMPDTPVEADVAADVVAEVPVEDAVVATISTPIVTLPVVVPVTMVPESGLDKLDHPTATGPDELDQLEATPATGGLDRLDHPTASGLDKLDRSVLDHPVVTPAVAATSVAPTAPSTQTAQNTEAAPVSHPVLDQVKPTFTKLVSGPEGMHRMTLRLHPADLGEIHLTVRVQGDTVEVTVAASPEARAVLAENQGELRGLLESVGRTAGQITFRDLPGTAPVAAPAFTANTDGQSQASYQQQGLDPGATGERDGNGHNPGRPADQPASSPPDGRSGVPAEPRPTTTTTRSAGLGRGGLDVRM
jgi:hypothetical protein